MIFTVQKSAFRPLKFANIEKKLKMKPTNIPYFYAKQVNDVNFENMSNDDAVRILREIVSKPG